VVHPQPAQARRQRQPGRAGADDQHVGARGKRRGDVGRPAADLARQRPTPMLNGHQDWLDGLARAPSAEPTACGSSDRLSVLQGGSDGGASL
jgi:hypothetical protein